MPTDRPETTDIQGLPPGVSAAPPGRQARASATLAGMPVPSKHLKFLIEGTVDHHASQRWPVLEEVTIRWRGGFGYLTGCIGDGAGEELIPLARIEYLGDDDEWAFAIYDPATETYTDAVLHTGQDTGHPNDALDTAAIVHLTEHTQ
jgi:hypothetical protein